MLIHSGCCPCAMTFPAQLPEAPTLACARGICSPPPSSGRHQLLWRQTQILRVSVSSLVTAQLKCCWNWRTNKKLSLLLLSPFFPSFLNRFEQNQRFWSYSMSQDPTNCILPQFLKGQCIYPGIQSPRWETRVKPLLWWPRVSLAPAGNLSLPLFPHLLLI